jgi:23S rRNA (guanine2445-N2)-methyltransferase / 23S rRNA (guanine2069-N7)-methyltransferase
MSADRTTLLRNRLTKNVARLAGWRKREGVTCFRAYDRDIPELPLAIDLFEGEDGRRRAQMIAFAPRHGGGAAFTSELTRLAGVVGEVLGVASDDVHLQVRERERGGTQDADDAAQSADSFFVREGSARFLVRLGARRDPGLFLDHRLTRRLVADEVRGRSLLNLFAYTASFSVHAARAGAASTTSVDLSASTTRWAAENLVANGIEGPRHRVLAGDVFAFLDDDRDRYDVIVCDPPSVSKSRRATRDLDVQRDHPWLIDRCAARLAAGGALWFSTNLRDFRLAPLPPGLVVDDVTERTRSPDFHALAHRCFRISRG